MSPAVSESNQSESFASGLLDALVAIPRANASQNSLDPLLQQVLETVLHFTGFDCGALYIYLGEDVGINLGAIVTMIEHGSHLSGTLTFSESKLPGQALQSRQAIYIANAQEHPELAGLAQEAGYSTRLCLPIFFNNSPQGVLDLVHYTKRNLSAYHISQLEPALNAIAHIIASALLEVRVQTADDWLNRLNDFSNRILASNTYRQALDLTVRYILENTQACSASAFLFKDETLSLGLALDNQFRQILR